MLCLFACCPVLGWLCSFPWVLRFPPQSKAVNVNRTQWTMQVWDLYVSDRKKKTRNGIWVFPKYLISYIYGIHSINEKVRLDKSAYVYPAYTTVLSMKTGYMSPLFSRERCAFNVNQSPRAVWAAVIQLRPSAIQYLTNFESWFKFTYRHHGIEKRNNSQDWTN